MGEINIPDNEQQALRAVDMAALGAAIDECLATRCLGGSLRPFKLKDCGAYVSAKHQAFEEALREYAGAKAAKKLEYTRSNALRAGMRLTSAVQGMQRRVETEAQQRQYFFVEDSIIPPIRFDEHLEVRVNYRWRPAVDAAWTTGTITFIHAYDPRSDYTAPIPKRQPSASQREQNRQEALWYEWDYLMKQALYSLRDYFQDGGDGAAIPQTFQVRVDTAGRLNNFSCRFWREPSDSKA